MLPRTGCVAHDRAVAEREAESSYHGRSPASVTATSRRTAAFDGSARGGERVHAVAGELLGRDVRTDVTGLRGLGKQLADHPVHLVPCLGDARIAV